MAKKAIDLFEAHKQASQVQARGIQLMQWLAPRLVNGEHRYGQMEDPIITQAATIKPPHNPGEVAEDLDPSTVPVTLFLGGVAIATFRPEDREYAHSLLTKMEAAMAPIRQDVGVDTAERMNALLKG